METINYDSKKIKKKGNGPFIGIGIFLVVGIGIITYSLFNEVKPNVIGEQDSLKNVSASEDVKTNAEPEINIEYKVETNQIR